MGNPGVVAPASTPSTEVGAGGAEVQGHLRVSGKFEASLGYAVRPSHKSEKPDG